MVSKMAVYWETLMVEGMVVDLDGKMAGQMAWK